MKKFLLLLVLVAVFGAGHAQDGNLKSKFYFRVGYSVPGWKYGGLDGKSDWMDGTKRAGGMLEAGNIFMINALKIAPGMRIGINVDYISVDYNMFKYMDNSQNFVFIGSKIGPSFSYSPVKRLVFDVYFKFNPVWLEGALMPPPTQLEDDQFYLGYMGFKYSAGLNVRYSVLMAGIEINPGNARNMRLFNKDEGGFTDVYLDNANDNSHKLPVPAFNVTLGLCF